LINAKKIRDARALHRKQAESLAENGVKPAAAAVASDAVVADAEDRSAKAADRADTRAAADGRQDAATPQVPDAIVAANDPKLDARAEVGPVVMPEKKMKPVQNESQALHRPAGKTEAESVAARKSAKASPASEPAAGRSEVTTNKKEAVYKKEAVSKKKRVERVASASRQPVMMILRTIEFLDGRREQRLLPMSQARSGFARYGSISAFAGDDDF
jgi:hypothetical protein